MGSLNLGLAQIMEQLQLRNQPVGPQGGVSPSGTQSDLMQMLQQMAQGGPPPGTASFSAAPPQAPPAAPGGPPQAAAPVGPMQGPREPNALEAALVHLQGAGGIEEPESKGKPMLGIGLAGLGDMFNALGRGINQKPSRYAGSVADRTRQTVEDRNRRAALNAEQDVARAGQIAKIEAQLEGQRVEEEGKGERLGRTIDAQAALQDDARAYDFEQAGLDRDTQETLLGMNLDAQEARDIANNAASMAEAQLRETGQYERLERTGELEEELSRLKNRWAVSAALDAQVDRIAEIKQLGEQEKANLKVEMQGRIDLADKKWKNEMTTMLGLGTERHGKALPDNWGAMSVTDRMQWDSIQTAETIERNYANQAPETIAARTEQGELALQELENQTMAFLEDPSPRGIATFKRNVKTLLKRIRRNSPEQYDAAVAAIEQDVGPYMRKIGLDRAGEGYWTEGVDGEAPPLAGVELQLSAAERYLNNMRKQRQENVSEAETFMEGIDYPEP